MAWLKRILSPRTVANDLMLWLDITIFITVLIVGFFYYRHTTQNHIENVSKRAEITEKEIVQILSPQLFYIDNKAVQHTADIFLGSGRLSGIVITSEISGVLVDKPASRKSMLPMREQAIAMEGHTLGQVQLWFDDGEIRDAQQQTVFILILVLAAVVVINAVVIHVILKLVLVKPVLLLKSRIEELASGTFEGKLPAVPQHNLNVIMSGVNNMAEQLADKTRQLADSEEKYREIFNATDDAILIHDTETGSILEVNNAMLRMFGYEYDEVFALSLDDLSCGADKYTGLEAVRKLRKTVEEGPQSFEWQVRRKNGEHFWVEIALTRTSIGGEGRVLSVVRDITRRKWSEAELLREQAFNEAIIRSLPGIFYVYNDTLRLVRWNRNLETLTGFSADELRNRSIYEWFDDPGKDQLNKALQVITKERWAVMEAPLITKNGAPLPVQFFGREVKIEDHTYLVGVGFDLSEQKKIEEELRQAQKMEAIGTLAGGIAHDFNNILGVISGYTEMAQLKIKKDQAKAQEYLSEVFNAVTRAKELVQQILTFSRKTEHEQSPLKFSMLLKESLKMLRPMIPSTIEIRQNIDAQETVMADPTQVHQVIMNLCTNAYGAMLESGGLLEVTLHTVEIGDEKPVADIEPGQYLHLQVRDNGTGMSEEVRSKIFEPYFTTKEKGKGTGLGLAVVHGIVQSHHGYITVESEPGEGSAFHLYFPVISQEHEEFSLADQAEPVQGGSEHILFVDDEEKIVNIFQEMLQEYGYRVTSFMNGVQALQEFEKAPQEYDLVITDMTMPYMNGMKLARELLKIKPDIPVILCTGHSELVSREKALAMGIRDFCKKPLRLNNLILTARNVLDARE